jgi:hypothetical protein
LQYLSDWNRHCNPKTIAARFFALRNVRRREPPRFVLRNNDRDMSAAQAL